MTAAAARAREVVARLEDLGSGQVREQMRRQFGIVTQKAFGARMLDIQRLGRELGRDHALAAALWKTGWYEARILAAYVDDPALVTGAQMDAWVKDFDNWGICDTLCFVLFDRTAAAWRKVGPWCRRRDEFVRRAGFALLASLALHDKEASDARFLAALPLIERAATDERNFVKKGVSWALRSLGRRNAALNGAAVSLAKTLAASEDPTARWLARDALRDLESAAMKKRLAALGKASSPRTRRTRS